MEFGICNKICIVVDFKNSIGEEKMEERKKDTRKNYHIFIGISLILDALLILAAVGMIKSGKFYSNAVAIFALAIVIVIISVKSMVRGRFPQHWIHNKSWLNLLFIVGGMAVAMLISYSQGKPLFEKYNNILFIFFFIIADIMVSIKDYIISKKLRLDRYGFDDFADPDEELMKLIESSNKKRGV